MYQKRTGFCCAGLFNGLIFRFVGCRYDCGGVSGMFINFFLTAWRNLRKNRAHSLINISGLAVGMAVALLIGLWVWDELSFDKYDPHYGRVAQVMQSQTFNGSKTKIGKSIPIPLEAELRKHYGGDFKTIVMASWDYNHVLAAGDKKIDQSGSFMQPDAPELFGLTMIAGSKGALGDRSAIVLSQHVAKALFGNTDPINQMVRMDNKANFVVKGVYADPANSSLFRDADINFLAPWDYYIHDIVDGEVLSDWGNNSFQCFVELADGITIDAASRGIRDAKLKAVDRESAAYKPALSLHPMSKWHLYSDFKNGVNIGGRIQYVWLFGTIGFFVLLLACINFMNLSTARSEKRAKEVGIRKTIGSLRRQLIVQFYCESVLITFIAFAAALGIVILLLPAFNALAGKQVSILWVSPVFWMMSIGFCLFTGIVAGSYPALYLSAFRPIKVLKGSFRAGRFAALPRQVLVVLQFTVSVILIVGTIVVFRQVQYAKNRPVGYDRAGLVNMRLSTDEVRTHFAAMRTGLKGSGTVSEMALSSSPATDMNHNFGGFTWEGMDPNVTYDFSNVRVTMAYGKTVGWQLVEGRDFSEQFQTDSSAIVLNETAVKYMGFRDPIGKTVKAFGKDFRVIGVIRDVVAESPFEPVKQAVYHVADNGDYLNIRINPNASAHAAIAAIEKAWKTYAPEAPFSYHFVDDVYAKKFSDEERVGKLATAFTVFAIFISCLGLFGMASYMAEQRIKEIGVRKVLGASVVSLWGLLSKDFVGLVVIALVIALPLAGYFMNSWLQHYPYRTDLAWWVFAVTGAGALLITVLTVSYQSIRAALTNPVRSLRSE
jgi:ABC-type antimicrobial peptide transport system permease subunit